MDLVSRDNRTLHEALHPLPLSTSDGWERAALRRALATFERQRRGPAVQLLLRHGGWHVELATANARPQVPVTRAVTADHCSSQGSFRPVLEAATQFGPAAIRIARLTLQCDLRKGLAPATSPLFCVAVDLGRLRRASQSSATGAIPLYTATHHLLKSGSEGDLCSSDAAAPLRPPRGHQSTSLLLELPQPVLLSILARFLPAATSGGGAFAVARVCWCLAELVGSGDYWGAALAMRYKVVPSILGLAAVLGPAPCRREVVPPPGLSLASSPCSGQQFELVSPLPLTAEHFAQLGQEGDIGVTPRPPPSERQETGYSPSTKRPLAVSKCRFPALLLAATEWVPTVVLLEPVSAGAPVLEIFGEVAPLAGYSSGRAFFGSHNEVWIDLLDTRHQRSSVSSLHGLVPNGPGGAPLSSATPRQRLCISMARRGNEARWLRFCRHGEAPTLRLEVLQDPKSVGTSGGGLLNCMPRLVLVADKDLPAFTELTWTDLHYCRPAKASNPGDPNEAQRLQSTPTLRDLERLVEMLRVQKRAGAFPGAAGAHVFAAL